MATLLLHLADFNEPRWADGFRTALPGHRVVLRGDGYDPAEIDYIFVWKPKPDAFDGLVNLKAVLLSLGAGVDALAARHPAPAAGRADRALRRCRPDAANERLHRRQCDDAPAPVHPLQARPAGPPMGAALPAAGVGHPRRHHGDGRARAGRRAASQRCSATSCAAGAARRRRSRASRDSWARRHSTRSSAAPTSWSICCR